MDGPLDKYSQMKQSFDLFKKHTEDILNCFFNCNSAVRPLPKILIILGPFLTIEYFCLITEINTVPAGSSFQGHYEKGL